MADKKKMIVFEYGKILTLVDLLNSITVSGFRDIRTMATAASILDSGIIKTPSSECAKESEKEK